MIVHGADGKNGCTNIGKRNRLASDGKPSLSEIVVQKELPQILRMHAIGQARRVRIPGHEVAHWCALAHQVVADNAGPDKIVRAQ